MQESVLEKKDTHIFTCYIHPEKDPIGSCVGCGKFICKECSTEIDSKYYCKPCVNKLVSERNKKVELLENRQIQPNVFMNAGGASSSSTANTTLNNSDNSETYGTKNKITAALLALFLGSFGIHKFYLGQPIQGILYLLFCWTGIPFILGIAECLVYLSHSDKMFGRKYG